MPDDIIYQTHVITGMITFFVGPWQFIYWIRKNHAGLHRLFGRTYVICTLLSSSTGFVISFYSSVFATVFGTATQCLLWFWTTLVAYQRIRQKEYRLHQQWMLRSYALVLAAPIVRIGFIVIEKFWPEGYDSHVDFYYSILVWLGFVPLVLAEIYIRLSNRRKKEYNVHL